MQDNLFNDSYKRRVYFMQTGLLSPIQSTNVFSKEIVILNVAILTNMKWNRYKFKIRNGILGRL